MLHQLQLYKPGSSWVFLSSGVGRIMICYVTCLLSPVQRARKCPYGCLVHHILFTLQNLRNYTREDKIWIFRSVPNFVALISENLLNSYDSGGVILVSISALGNKKWNLPFSLFTCFFLKSPGHIWMYDMSLERYFQREHSTVGIMGNGKWFSGDRDILGLRFMNVDHRGEWVLDL